MTLSPENFAPIIERLILAQVDNERKVSLEANCLPGRINWAFRVDIDDMGKVMGIQGAHKRALELLVSLMGKRCGEQWVIVPLDPCGSVRGTIRRASVPSNHSTAKDVTLLNMVLVGLGIDCDVGSEGSIMEGFKFTIAPSGHAEKQALLEKHKIDYKLYREHRTEDVNIVSALGTLFRGIGRRQGVKYRIAVPD